MAHWPVTGAPITPELTEEGEERSSTGAGAMATSHPTLSARQHDDASPEIMFSNTAQLDAMGQNESRETVRLRNDALHRAGIQIAAPRPGKLSSRSTNLSHGMLGQRRLRANVLADANTYEVPSDDEPAPSRRSAATAAQFSPLKRQIAKSREEKRRQEDRERQAALDRQFDDAQLEEESDAEDIESRREGSRADMTVEDAAEHEVSESSVSGIQPGADGEEPEVSTSALNESISEPLQHNVPSKKRGRPRKSKKSKTANKEPENAGNQPPKKRGRPSNAELEARRLAAHEAAQAAEAADILGGPSGMTDDLDAPVSPLRVAPNSATQNSRLSRSLRASTAPSTSKIQLRQASTYGVVAQNSSNAEAQVVVANDDEPLFVEDFDAEQPDIVRPEELGDMDNGEDNDQTHAADDQPAGEDEEEGDDRELTDYEEAEGDDDDEHVDETEVQLEPMANDRHRLYGHWHKIREVMREVAKHKGNTVRIKDDEFKGVIQACKQATMTVSAAQADTSPDVLSQTVVQCKAAIARASRICENREALTDARKLRKRAFHIFKHLLPALAKLLRAAIKAFERVDRVGIDADQVSLDHLSKIVELLFAVEQCGESAYRVYPPPSKPIKQAVHNGITIHLRELHSSLSRKCSPENRRREEQQQNQEIAREMAARDEERERQSREKKLEERNQNKWKRMNAARFDVSKNSGDIRKHLHLRSCPMTIVQTDADGQPYLPTTLRGRRGQWTDLESNALEIALRNHVDTSAPLDSMVFERIIAQECPFRRPLTNKNVLEIVIEANEIKDFWTSWSRETGALVDEWVEKIPRWMDPPWPEHDNGSSAADAIEIE